MPHDPQSVLLDMVQAIETAIALAGGESRSAFLGDKRTRWAVYSQIIILGEAGSRLPRNFCENHPEIPWSSAIGMRHRLVHGYDSVDWERVWKTLKDDLPHLLEQLRALVPQEGGQK